MEETYNLEKRLSEILSERLSGILDGIIILGLEKKGFRFNIEYTKDFYNFFKTRCRIERDFNKRIDTYYVNNVPFLQVKNSPDFHYDFSEGRHTISTSIGEYQFL